MLQVLVAHHPLRETPYNKLLYVGANAHGTPLYQVLGMNRSACSAPTALRSAFTRFGGECYYCGTVLKPQAKPSPVSLDHVVAKAGGGTNLLHNFVIACKQCNREKASQPIQSFNAAKARDFMTALERHIAESVRAAAEPNSTLT
jgi:hypothetical protein